MKGHVQKYCVICGEKSLSQYCVECKVERMKQIDNEYHKKYQKRKRTT